jgi:nitrogen regulatory protein PII
MQNNLTEFLITITERHAGELVISTLKEGGATVLTKISGRQAMTETHESIAFSLMDNNSKDAVQKLNDISVDNASCTNGTAILLELSDTVKREKREMGYNNILITCITKHGTADNIMAAARKAGARGGTVLNARGTGTEADAKFFGITLAPEKDILLIVADVNHSQPILDTIRALPEFNEQGSGIIFTMDVKEFIILGAQG